ncbi:MAG TPA: VOC family protein [Ktedonobacterales bacterium]|nr:VOC family protein [Ktedonobacterales bacterium]
MADTADTANNEQDALSLTLGSVIIATANPARLKAFYCEVLGVPVNAQGRLVSGGIIIHPAYHSAVQHAPAEPYRAMLTFDTADIYASAKALKARGVVFVREPEQEHWGGWVATFLDPDGNYLQLLQPAPT